MIANETCMGDTLYGLTRPGKAEPNLFLP